MVHMNIKPPEVDGDELEINRRSRVNMPFRGLKFRHANSRVMDFREVIIPFNEQEIIIEAARCIHCPDAPCMIGCPVHNDIPSACWYVEHGDFVLAARTFRKTNAFPEICGLVCPQEQLCQGSCTLNLTGEPVLIGAIENFVTTYERTMVGLEEPVIAPPSGYRVAVIGAGPAGLAAAERLSLAGHAVTVFDAYKEPGGLLLYGVPGFKLSPQRVHNKIDILKELGITFVPDIKIGTTKTIDDLLAEGFDAVFIGTGAGVDTPLNVEGEYLQGVYKGTDFLIRANVDPNLLPPHKRAMPDVGDVCLIIGGGDTASDCLRSAKRLGAKKVICIYRRSEAEMPGMVKDRMLAKEEGVEYLFTTQPIRFLGDENGNLKTVECVRMMLGEPDKSGRRRPVPEPGSNFFIHADSVITALGYNAYPEIASSTPDLITHEWGLVQVNQNTLATSKPGVFAGGDAINGPDLVVTATADGINAAVSMDKWLRSDKPGRLWRNWYP